MEQSTNATTFDTGKVQSQEFPTGSIAGHAAEGFVIVVLVIVLIVLYCKRQACSCCTSKAVKSPTDNILSVSAHSSTDSILSAIVIEPSNSSEEQKSRDPSKPPEAPINPASAMPSHSTNNESSANASFKYENVPFPASCTPSVDPLVPTSPQSLMVFINDLDMSCPEPGMPHTDPDSPSYTTIDLPHSNCNRSNIISSAARLSSASLVSTSDYENIPEQRKEEHRDQGYDNNLTLGYFSMEMGTPKQPQKELDPRDIVDEATVNQTCVETEPASYCNVLVNTPERKRDSKVYDKVDDADDDEDDDDYLHPISSKKFKKNR